MQQHDGTSLQASAGHFQHGRVAIQADQPALRAELLGDQPGVAAGADGGVDDRLAGRRIQIPQHLGRQHRHVMGHAAHDDEGPRLRGKAKRWLCSVCGRFRFGATQLPLRQARFKENRVRGDQDAECKMQTEPPASIRKLHSALAPLPRRIVKGRPG